MYNYTTVETEGRYAIRSEAGLHRREGTVAMFATRAEAELEIEKIKNEDRLIVNRMRQNISSTEQQMQIPQAIEEIVKLRQSGLRTSELTEDGQRLIREAKAVLCHYPRALALVDEYTGVDQVYGWTLSDERRSAIERALAGWGACVPA